MFAMKECGDVWMTSPTFPGLLALHAFACISVNPSKNTCRLCTVRYNVQSCATRQICRTRQVTQSKERLLYGRSVLNNARTRHFCQPSELAIQTPVENSGQRCGANRSRWKLRSSEAGQTERHADV